MKKYNVIIILSLIFLTRVAPAADTASLLQGVSEYSKELSRIEASEKAISLEKLLQQGNKLAAELKPVIERLSDTDFASVVKNMKGYVVNREEVILVEPNIRFFSNLAGKIGTEQDRLYFNFMLKVMPEGYWPAYIRRQTDVGGCIAFGNGSLSTLYKEGSGTLLKLAGYYRQQLDKTIMDIAHQLTAGTCACGKIASVNKEFQAFLEVNPEAPIADRVRARMEALQSGNYTVRENCIGGM